MKHPMMLTSHVAKLLGVTPARIRQMETRGELPAERIGGGVRLFSRTEVLRVAEERARRAEGERSTR